VAATIAPPTRWTVRDKASGEQSVSAMHVVITRHGALFLAATFTLGGGQ
jgi:hypothetical protein